MASIIQARTTRLTQALLPDCEALVRVCQTASQVLSFKDNPIAPLLPSLYHTSRDATLAQALDYAFFAVAF